MSKVFAFFRMTMYAIVYMAYTQTPLQSRAHRFGTSSHQVSS